MSIKVMIVDDSAVMREVMQQILAQHADIQVLGAAMDPLLALQKMERLWPDVILLDVEMPRMDGITFLRRIMATRPTPVVICSTLTERGAGITLEALSAGAVEVICKPSAGLRDFLQDSARELVAAIRTAARARVRAQPAAAPAAEPVAVGAKLSADALLAPPPGGGLARQRTTERIVAIGTSTGGTQALEQVLRQLPLNAPALAIVQHMPEHFTRSFAQRLDSLCAIEVREARDGDRMLPGLALIAPGGRHLLVRRSGAQYQVEVRDGPLVSRHRPSVDVLFRSAAAQAGRNALGIIMTGMGDDGARGLREMHESGAHTCAQDEESCVVFGMPKEAIRLGGVDQVLALSQIAGVISEWSTEKRER